MINTNFPYGDEFVQSPTENSIQISKEITSSQSIYERLLEILGIKSYSTQTDSAIYYIQSVVNYFLGILAVVSLLVIIYGFYKILFTTDKFGDSINQGKKYLKAGIIGILGIGLSWLITSFLFYIVGKGL